MLNFNKVWELNEIENAMIKGLLLCDLSYFRLKLFQTSFIGRKLSLVTTFIKSASRTSHKKFCSRSKQRGLAVYLSRGQYFIWAVDLAAAAAMRGHYCSVAALPAAAAKNWHGQHA
jgi:hypothetical protein